MTNNDTAKQQAEAPLTWTAKKEWGSVGNTHRAQITLDNGDQWSFVVDSPRKGVWVARGWLKDREDVAAGRSGSGDMKLYREDTTMKGAKAQAQAHANLAQTSTCAECRKISGHKLDCGTGRAADMERTKGQRVGLRVGQLIAVDEGAQLLAGATRSGKSLPQRLPGDAIASAAATMRQFGTAATSAGRALLKFRHHVVRKCSCPTPVHRMSCGQGAQPTVIRKAVV